MTRLALVVAVAVIASEGCGGGNRSTDSSVLSADATATSAGNILAGPTPDADRFSWQRSDVLAPVVEGVPGVSLGTDHPLFVQASAPDGRWVAACQAREDTDGDGSIAVHVGRHGSLYGDQTELYLMTAADPAGIALDQLLAWDADGRYLVILRNQRLELVDVVEARKVDLTAAGVTPLDDESPVLGQRAVSFAPGAPRLAYLRHGEEGDRLVVVTLPDGELREVAFDEGRLWRARLLGNGIFARVAVVRDSNGNGVIDFPQLQTSLAGGPCLGHPTSYSTGGYRGDDFEVRFLRVEDGTPVSGEVVAWDGAELLLREDDGALQWVGSSLEKSLAVPSDCGGRVMALHSASRSVLVACGPEGAVAPVAVFVAGARQDLGWTAVARDDWQANAMVRYTTHLVDMVAGQEHTIPSGGVQGVFGRQLLETSDAEVLQLRNLDDNTTRQLHGSSHHYTVWARQWGNYAAVQRQSRHNRGSLGMLVELEAGSSKELSQFPVAVHPSGAALVPRDELVGPLNWVSFD